MASEGLDQDPLPEEEEQTVERRRRSFGRGSTWLRGLLAIPVLLIVAVIGFLVWLDTDSGHNFVERQIVSLQPKNGLRIGIGDIKGSIYSDAVIEGLELSDPKGVFFSAPVAKLDWFPLAFLSNRLSIDELVVPKAELKRLPEFIPSEEKGPVLPGFDIVIDELKVGALSVDESVTGRPMTLALAGNADIRDGRAIVDLKGLSTAGDRIVLDIDAEPDGDAFDISADINAPDDGILPALAGFDGGFTLKAGGKGSWSDWKGSLLATYDGDPAANLKLSMADGKWGVAGKLNRPGFLTGLPERIIGDAATISLSGTYEDQLVEMAGNIATSHLVTDIDGGIDLGNSELNDLQLLISRLDIEALLPDARANGFSGRLWLDGPFDAIEVDYAARARQFFIGDTGFQNLVAVGDGVSIGDVSRIPVDVRASQVVGTGELAEQALSNLHVDGMMILDGSELTSKNLVLTTDQIDSKIAVGANLDSGRYNVVADGRIRDFNIEGFGQVDLVADVRIQPDAAGFFSLGGRIRADMDRLDIGFLKTLAGGLPNLDTQISLGRDKRFRFSNFTLRSPKFTFRGNGVRNANGLFDIKGTGRHSDYGELDMTLTGVIDRPKVVLDLESPLPAAGLADVHVELDPNDAGFALSSAGQSIIGPFDLDGQLLLPKSGNAGVRVDALTVAGSTAQGQIDFTDAGLTGTLDVAGGAINGDIALTTEESAQLVRADLAISGLSADGSPSLSIRQGTVAVNARFDGDDSDIDADFNAKGVRASGLALGSVDANANISNGTGKVTLSVGGTRGSSFEFDALANVAPDSINVVGDGSFRSRPLVLSKPIRLQRSEDGDGWELLPSELSYAGGSVLLGGRFGGSETLVAAEIDDFPLTFFDLGDSNLGLSGTVSGVASYADTGPAPTGEVQLQIRQFSRSGLYLASKPLDFAVNARLDPTELGLRAIIADDSKTLGRMQMMIDGMPKQGELTDRLLTGDLVAQFRYGGPAASLWRLAGIDLFDLQGPVDIAANVNGTLADPDIRGLVSSDNARLESAATGTVIGNIAMNGEFDGSRLTLSRMSGKTEKDGSIKGSGSIVLSGATGPVIDLSFQAKNALLLNRDDFSAQVTGPLTVKSTEGGGGTISGDFKLNRADFDLGSASSAQALPNVRVVNINGRPDAPDQPLVSSPWTLDVSAVANNKVYVTGLGLDSEWRADLDISGPVDSFRLLGEAKLVRGEFDFAGKTFDLTRGEIGFVGGDQINPTLDIAASADVEGIDASVSVTGRGQSPQIAFSSVPALPQEELLSRILFGASITDLSAAEALQLGAAVASLQSGGGGGLDPINAVRQAAGLDRLRIIGADEKTGTGTSIAAGKYLSSKTYVELVTDGRGYSATQVEYQITRWLSILSSISTMGRQTVSARVSKDY